MLLWTKNSDMSKFDSLQTFCFYGCCCFFLYIVVFFIISFITAITFYYVVVLFIILGAKNYLISLFSSLFTLVHLLITENQYLANPGI